MGVAGDLLVALDPRDVTWAVDEHDACRLLLREECCERAPTRAGGQIGRQVHPVVRRPVRDRDYGRTHNAQGIPERFTQ
jgi:hypothetical protein